MTETSEWAGRIALVTGAARGIGAALVNQLLAQGATVVAADIAFAQPQLTSVSPRLLQVQLDVSDSGQVQRLVDEVEQHHGAIDYLASVAGVLLLDSVLTQSDDDWQRSFAVNCHGPFYLCRAVGNKMRARGRGAMVAVSSNAAHTPRLNMASYCAAKAALTALVKNLALELATDNIRCNLVAPGSTDTLMQQQLWQDQSGAAQTISGDLASYKVGIPLAKLATPDDIASSILFLLSTQANHITMAQLTVDGGATLGH
ncbi:MULTISPECIES: 2,3-dihydro-2,3-dihydroxybenzoate dehydrogenase [unclassified Pseudoalteromonas]|uniref:2,3-dihydro-2,3-dihydroxybenzoate dehydrogenase n=1 Tax=unclassified Pseudoalteromonas TaxID=194690 RepID=UPI003014E04A